LTTLGEQYFGRRSADHKLSDDLRPVLEPAQRSAFVQLFWNDNSIARHEPDAVEAEGQKTIVALAADGGSIGADDKRPLPVAIARGPAGKSQIVRKEFSINLTFPMKRESKTFADRSILCQVESSSRRIWHKL
jgi:hypothetical protein